MNYNDSKQEFDKYLEECKNKIITAFFEDDIDFNQVSAKTIKENPIKTTESTHEWKNRLIKLHRLEMINLKLDHTMRMIGEIIKINEELGIKVDFKTVLKIAILYHDIGRFEQATWTGDFGDDQYKKRGKIFLNHGEAGKQIFLEREQNFAVDEQYAPIISESILHHVKIENANHLHHRFNDIKELRALNIHDIITGKFQFNDAELQIASLITQLVADIDKTDILYQYLTGEIPLVREALYDESKKSLDEIALHWAVSKKDILEYNKIEESDYNKLENDKKEIKIPVEKLEISKLEVPKDIKEMFFSGNWKPLQELRKRPDWNFICALWWRISVFINNINFYSVLVSLEETKLLDQIYNKMPDKYKPLIEDAIAYAKTKIIPNIKGDEPRLYTR